MAMGTRRHRQRQEELWCRRDLAEAPGHPFYRKLEEVLEKAGFDEFCEAHCRQFYHEKLGRPSLTPGMYFRVMLIGFFGIMPLTYPLLNNCSDLIQIDHSCALVLGHYLDMKKPSPKQILAIHCPTCGAAPGEKCELATGQPRTEPHRDRGLIAADSATMSRP